jgi:hypothetical protein
VSDIVQSEVGNSEKELVYQSFGLTTIVVHVVKEPTASSSHSLTRQPRSLRATTSHKHEMLISY